MASATRNGARISHPTEEENMSLYSHPKWVKAQPSAPFLEDLHPPLIDFNPSSASPHDGAPQPYVGNPTRNLIDLHTPSYQPPYIPPNSILSNPPSLIDAYPSPRPYTSSANIPEKQIRDGSVYPEHNNHISEHAWGSTHGRIPDDFPPYIRGEPTFSSPGYQYSLFNHRLQADSRVPYQKSNLEGHPISNPVDAVTPPPGTAVFKQDFSKGYPPDSDHPLTNSYRGPERPPNDVVNNQFI